MRENYESFRLFSYALSILLLAFFRYQGKVRKLISHFARAFEQQIYRSERHKTWC